MISFSLLLWTVELVRLIEGDIPNQANIFYILINAHRNIHFFFFLQRTFCHYFITVANGMSEMTHRNIGGWNRKYKQMPFSLVHLSNCLRGLSTIDWSIISVGLKTPTRDEVENAAPEKAQWLCEKKNKHKIAILFVY